MTVILNFLNRKSHFLLHIVISVHACRIVSFMSLAVMDGGSCHHSIFNEASEEEI